MTSIKLPSQLVELGRALELDCDSWHWSWNVADKMKLFCNVQGNKLVILWMPLLGKRVKHPKNVKKQNFSKARGLYSKFQGFNSDDLQTFNLSDVPLKKIGRANFICYQSDKWNKPKIDYKHDFKASPIVYVDNELPHVLLISSGKLKVTNRGIEG